LEPNDLNQSPGSIIFFFIYPPASSSSSSSTASVSSIIIFFFILGCRHQAIRNKEGYAAFGHLRFVFERQYATWMQSPHRGRSVSVSSA
jgi:hypothetical protein